MGVVTTGGGLVLRWGHGSLSLLCTECMSTDKANDALVVDAWSGRTWSAGVPLDVVHSAALNHHGQRHWERIEETR